MKIKLITTIAILFLSCSNDKKATEYHGQVSQLKSDILLEVNARHMFSDKDSEDDLSLTISGKSLLKGTAVLKVTNSEGDEIHCETFPATQLIQPEYKTANSTLKAKHLKEVIDGFFVDTLKNGFKINDSYVGI